MQKAGNPSTINFDDIFYGTGLGRQQFYFSFLQPWNIIMASSSTSNEIAVLAKEKDSDVRHTHARTHMLTHKTHTCMCTHKKTTANYVMPAIDH